MEEFVRMVNVYAEMDSAENSASKKVSIIPCYLIIVFAVGADLGGSNFLAFVSVALIIATLATAHFARSITKKS